MQFTPVGRQDFGIHQGFQCIQYHRLHSAQPGLHGVYLLTDKHITKPEDTGTSPAGVKRLSKHAHDDPPPPGLTLCCNMASRALNSKGREWVCDDAASCGAKSKTNQRSRLSPRKSNTSKEFRVTMAFKDYEEKQQANNVGAAVQGKRSKQSYSTETDFSHTLTAPIWTQWSTALFFLRLKNTFITFVFKKNAKRYF